MHVHLFIPLFFRLGVSTALSGDDRCHCLIDQDGEEMPFNNGAIGGSVRKEAVVDRGCFHGGTVIGDMFHWIDNGTDRNIPAVYLRECNCSKYPCHRLIRSHVQRYWDTPDEVGNERSSVNTFRRFLLTYWGAWSQWSTCSVTCGQGITFRGRACPQGVMCSGKRVDMQSCNAPIDCKDDDHWRSWNDWTACSVPPGSGLGIKHRTRQCSLDSHSCEGPSNQAMYCCEIQCPGKGVWTNWEAWTACNKSCGHDAVTFRSRVCIPSPVSGALTPLCTGDNSETRLCPYVACTSPRPSFSWSDWSQCNCDPCPCSGQRYRTSECSTLHACRDHEAQTEACEKPCFLKQNGGWNSWTPWSSCGTTCGAGHRAQLRFCSNPEPRNGGDNCIGNSVKTETCINNETCHVDGNWSEWQGWLPCSGTCVNSNQLRVRTCTNPQPSNDGKTCAGSFQDTKTCQLPECAPVDGQWGTWISWTYCSATCGPGSKQRSRSCSHPKPQHGGRYCVPSDGYTETALCNEQLCLASWSSWLPWVSCSSTCGQGLQTRSRVCGNGHETCIGKFHDLRQCDLTPCPVDGGWAGWQTWTSCSHTCGNGTSFRTRTCTNPAPQHGGSTCAGRSIESSNCLLKLCPVDGQWGTWNSWTYCSATCGLGSKQRSRPCNNPKPQNGGQYCAPSDGYAETVHCNEQLCSVDGGWADWQTWTSCSHTCGNGTRSRNRTCTNPAPQHGGRTCPGGSTESNGCLLKVCPVDGQWTNWLPWSRCSVTCGRGVATRTRACAHPVPQHHGRYCAGNETMTMACVLKHC